MAENPANWGEAIKVIHDAVIAHMEATQRGYIGFSMAAAIATALEKAGFLDHDDVWQDDPREPTPEPPRRTDDQ